MISLNLILGIISAIAVGVIVIGVILMDTTVWYMIDIFHGVLLTIVSVTLIRMRNTKKQ